MTGRLLAAAMLLVSSTDAGARGRSDRKASKLEAPVKVPRAADLAWSVVSEGLRTESFGEGPAKTPYFVVATPGDALAFECDGLKPIQLRVRTLGFGNEAIVLEVERVGDAKATATLQLARVDGAELLGSGLSVEGGIALELPPGKSTLRVRPAFPGVALVRVALAEEASAKAVVRFRPDATPPGSAGPAIGVARVGMVGTTADAVESQGPKDATDRTPPPVAPSPASSVPGGDMATSTAAASVVPSVPANGAPGRGLICIDANANGICDPADPTIGAPRLLLGDTLTEVALDGAFGIPAGADEVVIDSKDVELPAGLWLRDKVKVKPAELKPDAVVSVALSIEVTARRSGSKDVDWGTDGRAKATELGGYTFDAEPLRRKFGRKDTGPAPAPPDADVAQLGSLAKLLERRKTRLFATVRKDPKVEGAASDEDVGRITENLVRFLREKFELKVDDITVDVAAPVANRAIVEVRVFQRK